MQTKRLTVTGMTCGVCSSAVRRALKGAGDVIDVDVSLNTSGADTTSKPPPSISSRPLLSELATASRRLERPRARAQGRRLPVSRELGRACMGAVP